MMNLSQFNKNFPHLKIFPARERPATWLDKRSGKTHNAHPKSPYIKDWQKLATNDAEQIRQWQNKWPNALAGLPTGELNGIVVVDLDLYKEYADLSPIQRALGAQKLSDTTPLIVRTPSNGWHLYYRHDPSLKLRNRTGGEDDVCPGVDIRSSGGYVVCAGRPTDATREYLPVRGNFGLPLGGMPQALAQKLHDLQNPIRTTPSKPKPQPTDIEGIDRYCLGALRSAASEVAQSQEGGRNHALNKQAFKLKNKFINQGQLSQAVVEAELTVAADKAGLTSSEIKRTLASAFAGSG